MTRKICKNDGIFLSVCMDIHGCRLGISVKVSMDILSQTIHRSSMDVGQVSLSKYGYSTIDYPRMSARCMYSGQLRQGVCILQPAVVSANYMIMNIISCTRTPHLSYTLYREGQTIDRVNEAVCRTLPEMPHRAVDIHMFALYKLGTSPCNCQLQAYKKS